MKRSNFPAWVYYLFLLNSLEHYLTSLKIAFIPLVPHFFYPEKTYLEGLLILFTIYPIGIMAKPLGGLFFQLVEKRAKLVTLLKISYFGTGFFSILLGIIPLIFPDYFTSTLIICRFFKSFFSASEVVGVSVLLKQNLDQDLCLKATNFIGTSSMLGIWSSFVLSSIVHLFDLGKVGFALAHLVGCFLLLNASMLPPLPSSRPKVEKAIHQSTLFDFCLILLFAGFSAFCYSCAFIVVPTCSTDKIFYPLNGMMITLDLFLIWYFGKKSIEWGTHRTLFFALLIGLVSPLLLYQTNSIISMGFFVLLGTLFSAPLYSYLLEDNSLKSKVSFLSWGYLIGSQLFGTLTPIASFGIKKFCAVEGSIFWMTSFFCLILLFFMARREQKIQLVEEVS